MYEKPEMVAVSGAINPGKYALVNKKDRLSDIILRAGGLTSLADIKGFALKDPFRPNKLI
jgi:protein involved in polysaccharide export with SLBB domain